MIGIAAATLLALSNPVAVASAEQVSVPDVLRTIETPDGWRISLTLTQTRIDSVPNMAAAPLSKEGYLSSRATLSVEGEGAAAVNSGQLVVGAQLGCQINLDDGLDLGVDFDTDLFDDVPLVGVGPDIGANLRSGGITTVGFGTKPLMGRSATITVLDGHVEVHECGGAVTARLFASTQVSTDTADDSLSVYSAVLPL